MLPLLPKLERNADDPPPSKWNLWARLDPRLRPLILLFLIITTCYALVFNNELPKSEMRKPPLPPLPSYDLASLGHDLATDPAGLRARILNDPIEVSGIIVRYDDNFVRDSYIVLASHENPSVPAMSCAFAGSAAKRALSDIAPGQSVLLGGTWKGDTDGNIPLFTSCYLRY